MTATRTVDDRIDDTRRAIAGCTATTLVREQHDSRTYDTCVPLTENSLGRLGSAPTNFDERFTRREQSCDVRPRLA